MRDLTTNMLRPAPAFFVLIGSGCVLLGTLSNRALGEDEKVKPNLDVPTERAIKDLMEGKFVKPAASKVPTSYFFAHSSEGDYIGMGQDLMYRGDKLKLKRIKGGVEVSIGKADWVLSVVAPKGSLKAGEYLNAKRFPFNEGVPGLSFSGMGRGSNKLAGKFVVWEFEADDDEVTRLAIDFIQRNEEKQPPLYGVVRFNSLLK